MDREPRTTDDLEELLDLEEIDADLYRGINDVTSLVRRNLYGGQVAAQALRAAGLTVPDGRRPTSLHGYFLRPGRPDRHVILKVARDRDGRSFSSRHVVAVQDGEVIFSMSAAFQTPEAGVEWSSSRPPALAVEEVDDDSAYSAVQGIMRIRPLPPIVPYGKDDWPMPARMWVTTRIHLPDDPVVHACVLTYASDMGSGFADGTVEGVPRGGVSIDHAVWFHQPIRMDDWVLLETWPLKAGGGRGLYMGAMQDRTGRVGAMLTQDSLLRVGPRPPRPPGTDGWPPGDRPPGAGDRG
jgi:acyl-CoA thioesterase-2